MALADLTWYQIIVSPFTAPPWVSGSAPTIPATIANQMLLGTPIYVFCVSADATYATIAYNAGTSFGMMTIPQACVTTVSTPTMDTTVLDNGTTWYSIRSGTGAWIWYDGSLVYSLNSPGTLGTFIS